MARIKAVLATLALSGTLFGAAAAVAPQAHAADLVQVCITLQDRALGVTINGHVILGQAIVGVPRTCVGI